PTRQYSGTASRAPRLLDARIRRFAGARFHKWQLGTCFSKKGPRSDCDRRECRYPRFADWNPSNSWMIHMKTKMRSAIGLCVAAALLCPMALFAQGAQKKLSVGLVLINLQAKFFNDINAGAADAAQKAGVNLQAIDGNNDPAAQVNAVETLTQQKVDGIIMVAIDVKGILPALQDPAKGGGKGVAADAKVQDPSVKSFIGVDNAKAGSDFGDFVGKYIKTQMGGKAKLGIIGALNSFIQNQRKDSFVESIKKVSGVTIGNTVDGQNVQ